MHQTESHAFQNFNNKKTHVASYRAKNAKVIIIIFFCIKTELKKIKILHIYAMILTRSMATCIFCEI